MVEKNHSEADLALFLKSYILVARSYSPTGNDIHQMVPLSSLTINLSVKFIRGKFLALPWSNNVFYEEVKCSSVVCFGNRDLKHRWRNAEDADQKWDFPARTFWACVRLSRRRPFFDDEIHGGLPLSLKHKYKNTLFAGKSLFFHLVIQYK